MMMSQKLTTAKQGGDDKTIGEADEAHGTDIKGHEVKEPEEPIHLVQNTDKVKDLSQAMLSDSLREVQPLSNRKGLIYPYGEAVYHANSSIHYMKHMRDYLECWSNRHSGCSNGRSKGPDGGEELKLPLLIVQSIHVKVPPRRNSTSSIVGNKEGSVSGTDTVAVTRRDHININDRHPHRAEAAQKKILTRNDNFSNLYAH